MSKIVIYTKWCLECTWPEETKYFRLWAGDKKVKVKRTSYRPDWHLVATKRYGSEDYNAFVIYKGKIEDFVDFANKCKNKLIKEGKLKNDMCGLQQTEDDNREDCLSSQDDKDAKEDGV